MRCSEIESGGAAGGLVPLPIVPRRIKTSGRYVMWRWQGSGRDTFAIVLELTSLTSGWAHFFAQARDRSP